jgi:hypothetical protein
MNAKSLAYGADALRQVFETYARLAKAAIDHDPGDTRTLSEINRFLDEFLRHWEPEHAHPQSWEIELLEQRPDVDRHQLADAQRQAAENEERARMKGELEMWRAVQRFGLLWWAQRQLRETGDDVYLAAWGSFVGYFGNVSETARVADRAIQEDVEDRGLWMHWVLDESSHGAGRYGPAIDLEFLQTFILVALNYIEPDGPPPQFEPLERLADEFAEPEQQINAVLSNERLGPLLPAEDLDARAALLVAAISGMLRAREELEDERVIASPLDEAIVQDFKQRVRSECASHRLVTPALQYAGMYEVIEDEPDADVPRWGLRPHWMPKNWLIPDARIGGLEAHAEQLGREFGESEVKRISEAAADADLFVPAEGVSIAQTLRAAVAEVRAHGEHVVVYVPIRWQLLNALELTFAERRGGTAQAPRWLPGAAAGFFVGSADDAPVLDSRELVEDRILVVALDTFARWRRWRPPGEDEVTVSITAYDDEAARELVAENPGLFRDDEHTTDEARVREVRKRVILDVHERLDIDILRHEAARWVAVPEPLQEQ